MSILLDIDSSIRIYLDGKIKNPILDKVIEAELYFSNNLTDIFKKFFKEVVESANYNDKLNNLSKLFNNVSNDIANILKPCVCNSFLTLLPDEHIFLIMAINDNNKNIFELMTNDPSISDVLKYLLSGLTITIDKEEYLIKCINACQLINKNISNMIVEEYISNNGADIISNDRLLTFFIKYITTNAKCISSIIDINIDSLLKVKLASIKEHLNKLPLTNMEFAFEIYKLGKIIIDSQVLYINQVINFNHNLIEFNHEQMDYIVKSIHTCIVNNNINQAHTILAIVFYLDSNNLTKFIEYYNKYLLLRMNMKDILSVEYSLWNINNDYKKIVSNSELSSYNRLINNVRYSNIMNEELTKIKIKNSDIKMNKVNVWLAGGAHTLAGGAPTDTTKNTSIVHHKNIQEYIDNMNIYIKNKSPLQYIQHDMEKSKIKIKTSMGSINCSLIFGSILLYLNDNQMTINELSKVLKMNEDDVRKRINSLIKLNIVIENNVIENNYSYKYIEPFGDVDCQLMNDEPLIKEPLVINKFTDIIMTMDSRIIMEVKPKKMNKLELERRIQEFMGDSYVRSIFYQRLESLIQRYYIEVNNDIIEYSV